MNLDFSVTTLVKPRKKLLEVNNELINVIKNRQQAAQLSNLQLAKRFGHSNINKILRRLQHFEQTGYLPDAYFQQLGKILNIELAEIERIQVQYIKDKFADMGLFIKNFERIWLHRKFIIRNPDYANISFPGLYLSVAYLVAPSCNIGLLLQHYMNGDWLLDNVCCDRVYIVGAGGSPLSGNNTCHGFCRKCHSQRSFKLPAFGSILKSHKELQQACEQRVTVKTMIDLLNDF